MLKIEKPAVKFNDKFDAYIARYPVWEGDELKYYIYLTESEPISNKSGENLLEKFKKHCEEKILQFSQEKLVKLLKEGKRHNAISPCLDNDGIIKMINEGFGEYISDDDCYIV